MSVGRSVAGLTAVTVLAALCVSAASAAAPLRTGVFDPELFAGPDGATAFARTKAAGASVVRLAVNWSDAAPSAPADARDPNDPAYHWDGTDTQVRNAMRSGLDPILNLVKAPAWAQTGTPQPGLGPVRPKISDLAAFSAALARRYGGGEAGVPRVHYFQLWNEPNLSANLMPQTATSAADWYRAALNAFAAAVHGVHADNLVVGGGLAPYGIQAKGEPTPATPQGVAPMSFMRRLLCVSTSGRSTCNARVNVDVWAFHPYTWGGPTHHAYSSNDLAIGDIPRAQALLRTAIRLGHLRSHGALRYWVTEFSWDTDPPDPKAIPVGLQARWTSEALYRFWSDGVSLVTWFLLRDYPLGKAPFQSGLYYAGSTIATDRPKPTLRAFRFPFVAILRDGGYDLWGRTPSSKAATVIVERAAGSRWQRVLTLQAGANGIFQTRWKSTARSGFLRARLADGTDVSLPFGLRPVPDRRISPFGS